MAKLRPLFTYTSQAAPGVIVRGFWNPEHEEYTVQIRVNGQHNEPADYFTDDRQDAENTGFAMLSHYENTASPKGQNQC